METAGGFVHKACKRKTTLDGVVVCCKYNKTVEHLIAELKYNFYTDIVNYLAEYYEAGFLLLPGDKAGTSLVPVPLHKRKLKSRGFNQAELIAKKLISKLRVSNEIDCQNLLVRIRNTKTQVGMSRKERIENLEDVFRINPKEKIPERVVLIDDVMTTGTTLEECAYVLKNAGTKKIYALVFARG
ncbi:ComF family protein [Candidatus Dojkabacteria bacterium]|nr:ComF family protein [Candidatus Dojkabacteria bacterium]